jgi:hypothetical protein
VFEKLKAFFAPKPAFEVETPAFIFVVLPGDLEPDDRHARYEEPLDAELQLAGIGGVSGGGTGLGEENADGSRDIEFSGIDVDVTNLDAGLELLRVHLPILGCPPNTRLEYSNGGVGLFDEYDGEHWQQARST